MPLTSDQLFVGQWRDSFLLPQDSNAPDHASFKDQHAQGRTDGRKYICYLNNVGTGHENDNCVGRKLAVTLS